MVYSRSKSFFTYVVNIFSQCIACVFIFLTVFFKEIRLILIKSDLLIFLRDFTDFAFRSVIHKLIFVYSVKYRSKVYFSVVHIICEKMFILSQLNFLNILNKNQLNKYMWGLFSNSIFCSIDLDVFF